MKKLNHWLKEPVSSNMLKYSSVACAIFCAIDVFQVMTFFDLHKYGLGIGYIVNALLALCCTVLFGLAYKIGKEDKEESNENTSKGR
jgi:hypothetical protein